MANTDEADDKKLTGVHDIQSAVETAGAEDESVHEDGDDEQDLDNTAEADEAEGEKSTEGADTEEEDSEGKTDEDESEGDESEADDSKPTDKSERRFAQLAGDGKPETYITNLEKAYSESSAEALRLNQELKQSKNQLDGIMRAVGTDTELANKLHAALTGSPAPAGDSSDKGGSDATKSPFLVDAESQWREKSEKEAQEFMDANPEVVSDPKINADVKHYMEVFSADEYNRNGRLMTAGEAMAKAYKYLGLEDKRETRKGVSDAKKAVAPTRPQGARKPAPKTAAGFTDSQLAIADQMGYSKEKLEKFAK